MSANFKFGKELRLLNAGDYSKVFENVQLRVSSKHFLILAKNQHNAQPRLGIIVAKKHVKLAVQRNKVKRQLRETFRKEQHLLPCYDLVLLAKKGANIPSSIDLTTELNFLWSKLKRKASTI